MGLQTNVLDTYQLTNRRSQGAEKLNDLTRKISGHSHNAFFIIASPLPSVKSYTCRQNVFTTSERENETQRKRKRRRLAAYAGLTAGQHDSGANHDVLEQKGDSCPIEDGSVAPYGSGGFTVFYR